MEPRSENLAILYQGALTAAVRVQARRQQVGNALAFRRRMKDVLVEIGREAVRRNYTSAHSNDSDFAFTAFLDEVILTSDDPCRNEWALKPLQEDLFGVSTAGELFFTRLDRLLSKPDTPENIDVLEVYYLCLLLGFQGRYTLANRAELQMYADRVRQRIERFRGVQTQLSPNAALIDENLAARPSGSPHVRLRLAAISSAAFASLCFIGFATHLYWTSVQVNEAFLRSVVP